MAVVANYINLDTVCLIPNFIINGNFTIVLYRWIILHFNILVPQLRSEHFLSIQLNQLAALRLDIMILIHNETTLVNFDRSFIVAALAKLDIRRFASVEVWLVQYQVALGIVDDDVVFSIHTYVRFQILPVLAFNEMAVRFM